MTVWKWVNPVDKGRRGDILPECSLSITGDAARGALYSSLLRKGGRRTTLLAALLLHLLTRWRSHALVGRSWLLHSAIAVVFLRELSLLLGGVVLERHYDCESV
jgi:hypothetical protein